jgi:glycosyltransferase involved in cell wall biosynthesis
MSLDLKGHSRVAADNAAAMQPVVRNSPSRPAIQIALLTGGSDMPYVFGLTTQLGARNVAMDLVGSDELDDPKLRLKPGVNFLNLRGSQRPDADFASKLSRIIKYYFSLMRYAATAQPKLFHILWNNKFETFDRTVLMLYYKLLGKRVVFTAHNVNAAKRDKKDSLLNRLTLRAQYHLADHIFVHTEKMKDELRNELGVTGKKVTVIPFGINNAVPNTHLTAEEAKRQLGLKNHEKAILFFGRITPYKGLEVLIPAFRQVLANSEDYRLIIAGRLDAQSGERYWKRIRETLLKDGKEGAVIQRTEFITDEQTEVYFKAADVLVLPYKEIYQSGVLFLGHSFGLPVIATDVGSLKDDIVENENGFVCRPEDPEDLAAVIERFFASDLYRNLDKLRPQIANRAEKQHSWDVVGQSTLSVYAELLGLRPLPETQGQDSSRIPFDVEQSS